MTTHADKAPHRHLDGADLLPDARTRGLSQALLEGRPARVRQHLAKGADANRPVFTHEVPRAGRMERQKGLTAVALAVLCACDTLEDERRMKRWVTVDAAHTRESVYGGLLPLLVGHADFSGVHGAGGQSLLHFAREPAVALWLMDHGAPCDLPDNEGKRPGDVLPPAVAALVNQHLLGGLAKAVPAANTARKRL